MKKKSVTILELATRLGLAPSTVSRALNDRHRISPETRARVKSLAIELGYQPNLSARHLRQNRTSTIGVLVPSLDHPFFPKLVAALLQASKARGQYLLLEIGDTETDLMRLQQAHTDGLMWFPAPETDPTRIFAKTNGVYTPLLFLGQGPQDHSLVQLATRSLNQEPVSNAMISRLAIAAVNTLLEMITMWEEDQEIPVQRIVVTPPTPN